MVEQDVDEVFLSFHFQAVLRADEREYASHLGEEAIHAAYQRRFQLLFAVFLPQAEKVEVVFVLYCQSCSCRLWNRQAALEIGLVLKIGQVKPCGDVVCQGRLAPTVLLGHAQVEFPLNITSAGLKDTDVLCPTDFLRQWCKF